MMSMKKISKSQHNTKLHKYRTSNKYSTKCNIQNTEHIDCISSEMDLEYIKLIFSSTELCPSCWEIFTTIKKYER
jgi:hypothetical protein